MIKLLKTNVFYFLFLITNILGAQSVSVSKSNICEETSFYLFIDDYSSTVYNSQWQYSIDQVGWFNLSNDAIYSGVNNEKLNISNVPYSLDNRYYRCLIDSTDDEEYDDTTSDFQLSLFTNIVAGSIDGNQVICYNTIPNLITTTNPPTGGDGNHTYQWFKSEDGINWNEISGAVQEDYQPSSLTESTFYRVEYFGSCNSLYSNTVEVEVYEELTSGEIIGGNIQCYNTVPDVLSFSTLPTGADGNYTYQWQESNDLAIWNDIIGATSTSYQDEALTSTKHYRNIISSTFGCGTETTNVVSVTVYPDFISGVINESDTICSNSIPNLITTTTLPTGGDGSYTYQWYISSDQSNWSEISGATNKDYQPSNLTSTTYYRVEYINSCKSGFSNISEVFVFPEIYPGEIGSNQTLCYGGLSNTLEIIQAPSGGGYGNYNYQWQKSNDGTIWIDLTGENSTTYSPGNLTQKTYFRLQTSSVYGCGPVATNTVEVEVYEELTSGEIIGGNIQCYNTVPDVLSFSTLPTGADGNYTYQWQESNDLAIWNDIIGATSTSYQDEALTSTKHYRNIISSTFGCGTETTNVVSVTVYPDFISGVINESDTICSNSIPNLITTTTLPTGGDGSYTYQWYISSDQSNWSEISGATNKDYQPSNLTSTTYYRVEYINSCKSGFSNISEVFVNTLPDNVNILGEENVCANQIDVIYKVSHVNEFYSYQWQCTNGEIVLGENSTECVVNWNNTPGVIGTVYLEQTIDSTGCSKITNLPIEISEYSAPNETSIIRKPSTNILIGEDESAELVYQWGYDIINSDNSVIIEGANLRYVQVAHELNFNEFRYWLMTSFEYEDYTTCETYTYFNPDETINDPILEEFLIYPNPAYGTVYFDNLNLKKSEVKVYTINGRRINYSIGNESTIILDKSTPPGIYLIRIKESGTVINKKIILN